MPVYPIYYYSKFQETRVPKFFAAGARVFAASAKDAGNFLTGLLVIRVAGGRKVR
jgi:hypothetical protein